MNKAAALSAFAALAVGTDAAQPATPSVVATLMKNLGQQHPTLPTSWTATVNEPQVGWVEESYKMVDRPTPENPSGKWTNFTDGSCQRLIFVPNDVDAARYLLGCESVACCTEEQSGNHLEYQIPNIHPAFLAPVKYGGNQKITIDHPEGQQETLSADVWSWKFGLGSYTAYTTGAGDKTILHKWVVGAEGNNYTSTYLNYTVPTDVAAFNAQFNVPAVCNGAESCDGLHAKGKLSEKALKFLKAGN